MIDPRREAFERVGGRYDVRVLEPSPPAVHEPPWFADDPVAPEPRLPGRALVSPVANGDRTWDDVAREEADLTEWCADRWLGAWRRLPPLRSTDALVTTKESWHVLAEHVLSAARRAANGKIGLRYTRGGVGTPFYAIGDDERQARLEGDELVVVRDGTERRAPITTVAAAADLVGVTPGAPADLYTPATVGEPETTLVVDANAARVLGDWFGFACSVLEELRVEAGGRDRRTQVWPEHFDISIDLGDEAAGTRGTFGASPGDAEHPVPYLYVTHWAGLPDAPFWNDHAFSGASLAYTTLLDVDDQRRAALDFYLTGVTLLSGRA